MGNNFCLLWSSPCLSMSEWRDVSLIISAFVALPGVLYAAFKTHYELKKLREEKARERLSRVHSKQLDALGKLFICLDKVQQYCQLMTKSAIFEGEKPEEYPGQLAAAMVEARNEFVGSRLLLPIAVVEMVERFFEKAIGSQVQLGIFDRLAGMQGEARAQYWTQAATIAHSEMPSLLSQIETSARNIIHGEEA